MNIIVGVVLALLALFFASAAIIRDPVATSEDDRLGTAMCTAFALILGACAAWVIA